MGYHRTEINSAGCDYTHQPSHAFLSAGAKGGDDLVVPKAGVEGVGRYNEIS
jgi:hypothetical protein